MSAPNKTAFIVMGPTASGKTALSIQIAQMLHTEIISADSRQCYKELSIGVARPSEQELSAVPHHFIASHSIHDQVDVAVFEKYALQKANAIFENNDHLVVCGGTGLYINAFCKGIDDIPKIDEIVRESVHERWEREGIEGLQLWLKEIDPEFWDLTKEKYNRVRLMRALEVKLTTGRSILAFQKGSDINRPFQFKKIFIDWPRDVLYQRINQRVDLMMEQGLLEEARSLYPYRELKALQTVGYQELFDHLNGKISLNAAIELIKQHTRNYAKRQITWFKKEGWDLSISGNDLQSGNIPWEWIKI